MECLKIENNSNYFQKNKNLTQINKIINSVKIVTLGQNMILYRFSPNLDEKPYLCNDTGKIGCYFSNNKIIPVGMCLEYNKPGYLHTYKLKKDIIAYVGKYSFRKLEFERFYQSIHNYQYNNFKKNINPILNYNHIEKNIYPIHPIFNNKYWKNSNLNNYEIFIGIDTFDNSTNYQKEIILEKISKPEFISYNYSLNFIKNFK